MSNIYNYLNLKDKLNYLMWYSDITVFRIFLAVSSIIWSVLLFWPGETFDRPTYTLMGRFASEWFWAVLFGVHGIIGLYASTYKVENVYVVILDGILGCILWTGSCIAMLLSVYPPPAAISAEITTAVFSWWSLIRYPSEIGGTSARN